VSWQIEGFIWLAWVVEKISRKHGVIAEEVEEAFFNIPRKVRQAQEEKYILYSRSHSGRYLVVVFVWEDHHVVVISARDMTASERRFYSRK
jgi:uncharacterized DUF497 family protein